MESVRLSDGRSLCYQRYGDPRGKPVYFFHGFPSSRLSASFLHEKARVAGVCLVASDRPGFGGSTALMSRTVLGWAKDVSELADHLQHPRFSVVGVSCGGAYALATAHELPQRVTRAATIAGIGPMDIKEIRTDQHPALRAMFSLAKVNPWLISPLLALDKKVYGGDVDRAIDVVSRMLTKPDREVLRKEPAVAVEFIKSMAEAYRQGIRPAMQEAALIASPRGFLLSNVRVPVHVFQGDQDRHVPLQMGTYLANSLPYSTFHVCRSEGHLSILWNRFDECLRSLTT